MKFCHWPAALLVHDVWMAIVHSCLRREAYNLRVPRWIARDPRSEFFTWLKTIEHLLKIRNFSTLSYFIHVEGWLRCFNLPIFLVILFWEHLPPTSPTSPPACVLFWWLRWICQCHFSAATLFRCWRNRCVQSHAGPSFEGPTARTTRALKKLTPGGLQLSPESMNINEGSKSWMGPCSATFNNPTVRGWKLWKLFQNVHIPPADTSMIQVPFLPQKLPVTMQPMRATNGYRIAALSEFRSSFRLGRGAGLQRSWLMTFYMSYHVISLFINIIYLIILYVCMWLALKIHVYQSASRIIPIPNKFLILSCSNLYIYIFLNLPDRYVRRHAFWPKTILRSELWFNNHFDWCWPPPQEKLSERSRSGKTQKQTLSRLGVFKVLSLLAWQWMVLAQSATGNGMQQDKGH